MGGRTGIPKLILNAAIFIALEVAAISMSGRSHDLQGFFLTKGAHHFMAKVWGGAETVKGYFSLKETNEALARENFLLRGKLGRFLTAEREEELLRDVADFTSGFKTGRFEFIPANIVKLSRNKQHNFLIIDKGSEDGVRERSGVLTRNGVAGIVDGVSRHYAYALSFMNTDFTLSARLGRTGLVGPLVWDGLHTDGALMKEIPLHSKFQPGDTVYTSGFSSIFPADIPIGVTGESRVVNGSTYEIRVRLLSDVGSMRYVALVRHTGAEEMEALEKENRSDR